jgi:hypothetical protein
MSVTILERTKSAVEEAEKSLKTFMKLQLRLIRNDLDLAIAPRQDAFVEVAGGRGDVATAKTKFAEDVRGVKERHFALLESISSLT